MTAVVVAIVVIVVVIVIVAILNCSDHSDRSHWVIRKSEIFLQPQKLDSQSFCHYSKLLSKE